MKTKEIREMRYTSSYIVVVRCPRVPNLVSNICLELTILINDKIFKLSKYHIHEYL